MLLLGFHFSPLKVVFDRARSFTTRLLTTDCLTKKLAYIMRVIFPLVLVLFALPSVAVAQYNSGFQIEYFFGNVPNIRAEAMGKADAAVGGSGSSLYFNPAGIAPIVNQEVTFSTSAPYYFLRGSDFVFLSYARRINDRFVGSLSVNRLAIGPTTFNVTIEGVRFPLDKPWSMGTTLTLAGRVIEGLDVGVNLNLFRLKFFDDVGKFTGFLADVGALYTRPLAADLGQTRFLRFGASINRIVGSSIKYESPTGLSETNVFPMLARIGGSYLKTMTIQIPGAGEAPFQMLVTSELYGILNNGYGTGVRIGGEALFYDVVAIRLGAYSESVDDGGVETNFDRARDLTYGFGLIVPLAKMTERRLPFNLHFDYVSLHPAERSELPYWRISPYMRGFGFRLAWVERAVGS